MSDAASLFRDGAAYERRMGRWSRRVGEVFVDWLAAPAGWRWLDVGCGNGAFTEVLIARCAPAAVSAIDPSEAQLGYARTRPGVALAEFRRGDAQALPYPDHDVDAATMALAISFIPDRLKAAREMTRVAKPGGLVATYMWDLPAGGAPVAPMHRALTSLGIAVPSPGVEASRREALHALWQQAGLQSVETRVIRIAVEFAGLDDFWQSCAVLDGLAGQVLASLSPADLERLQARLRDLLPIAADGRIAYEAFANAVRGRAPG